MAAGNFTPSFELTMARKDVRLMLETAAPAVPDAVRALAASGRHRVAVASYFTAPGRFATECAQAAPWIASAPLGTHPALGRLVLHRYDQALATPGTVPRPELASA